MLFRQPAHHNPVTNQPSKMNTEYKQALMMRISLYVDKLQEVTGQETPEKFAAVTALYQYLLTPPIKMLFDQETDEGTRARAVLLKKTSDYTNSLCKIANLWIFDSQPALIQVLDEMLHFLTDGEWGATLRRSDRLIKQSLRRYDQSCQANREFYAQLIANSDLLAELQATTAPRRPKVTVKILPRRSARLQQQL